VAKDKKIQKHIFEIIIFLSTDYSALKKIQDGVRSRISLQNQIKNQIQIQIRNQNGKLSKKLQTQNFDCGIPRALFIHDEESIHTL
jgi:hypothetical protein